MQLYGNLTEDKKKEELIRVIELVMIDTISTMLGIIDGSSTLSSCDVESKLYLDNIDSDSESQDLFLEFIEEIEK